MGGKLVRIVVLVLLAVLIATLSGLVGCAGGKEEAQEVIIGFIGDFTGPAAATCAEQYKGMTDYFHMIEEDDPIPGVEVKIITYDTRMDYARVPGGYVWLKGKGTDIFFNFNPVMQEILLAQHQADKIPSFTYASTPAIVGQEWIFSFSIHYPWEAEAIMEWILEDWEGRPAGPPKVGHIGVSGYVSTEQVTQKLEELHALNPDSFELKEEAAPPGTTAWAAEISRLKDCDIIIVNLLGPQTASFLREAIDRGYGGTFLGTSIAFLGFWDLVKAAVPNMENLDGALALQTQLIVTDDVPFMDLVQANLQRFRPGEAETLGRGTSYLAAQAAGLVLADTIKRAVAEVGADNVDAVALNDALKSIDITVEGYGEALKCHGGSNILHRMVRVIEYRAAEDDWYEITDWFLPPSVTAE
jgi:ABC-type branched-subunit amino acid transport system substrate-binding protein